MKILHNSLPRQISTQRAVAGKVTSQGGGDQLSRDLSPGTRQTKAEEINLEEIYPQALDERSLVAPSSEYSWVFCPGSVTCFLASPFTCVRLDLLDGGFHVFHGCRTGLQVKQATYRASMSARHAYPNVSIARVSEYLFQANRN